MKKSTGTSLATQQNTGLQPFVHTGELIPAKNIGTEITITWDNCRLSSANARKTYNAASIANLAATLFAVGQIHNVVVVLASDGTYELVAGGRRYRAWALLIEQGKIDAATFPIRAVLITAEQASSVSLIENEEREEMNAVDRSAAYARLVNEGWTIDKIADAMGVRPLDVERRLIVDGMSPVLKEKFRAGDISLVQMLALHAAPDHAAQERVWDGARSEALRNPNQLKRAALGVAIDATQDVRVAFIGGVSAYQNAGGHVRRDLLADADAGFIEDIQLLDTLVDSKLASYKATVEAEGWAWVSLKSDFDDTELLRLGSIKGKETPERQAIQNKIDPIEGRLARIDKLLSWPNEPSGEDEAKLVEESEQLQARLAVLEEQMMGLSQEYPADQKSLAGAVIAMEDGVVVIHRGRVRQEHRAAIDKLAKAEVRGGRESKAAGRKPEAMSESLKSELANLRNLAIVSELARHVTCAKALLAVRVVLDYRAQSSQPRWQSKLPTSLRDESYMALPVNQGDWCVTSIKTQIGYLAMSVLGKLPKNHAELWDAIVALPAADVDAIIALGVGLSFKSGGMDVPANSVEAKILTAIDFDMSQHFVASAENYTKRVPKGMVIAALKEAGKASDKAALEQLKSSELATVAAERLAGTRWVPALIRGPVRKAAKEKAKASTSVQVAKPVANKAVAKKSAVTKVVAKKAAKKVAKKAVAKAKPAKGKARKTA